MKWALLLVALFQLPAPPFGLRVVPTPEPLVAIAEVGAGSQRATSGNNDGVGSDTTAFPADVAAGSLLVVGGAIWGATAAPTAIVVTDTLLTTYTVVLGGINAGLTWRTFIAYGISLSAGANTVTVNPAGVDSVHSFSYSLDEFSGVDDVAPADVDGGTSTGDESSPGSDSLTTVAENALVVGVVSIDGPDQTITPNAAYTTIGENEDNSNNQCHSLVFQLVTTAQSYTVSWTFGSGDESWAAQTHSFKPDTGAGAAFYYQPYSFASMGVQ